MQPDPRAPDRPVPLRNALCAVRLRWRTLVAAMLASLLLGVLLALRVPTVYSSEALAVPDSGSSGSRALLGMGVPGALALGLGAASPAESQVELLRSLPTIRDALERVGIQMNEEELRTFREQRVSVQCDTKTVVVHVGVTWDDPNTAAAIANALLEAHMERQSELARSSAKAVTDYLDGQIGDVKRQIAQAEDSLYKYQSENGISSSALGDQLGAEFTLISQLESAYRTAVGEARASEAEAALVRKKLEGQGERSIAALTIAKNPVVQSVEEKLSQLEIERAGVAQVQGPNSSAVQQLDGQIASAKEEIQRAVRDIVQSTTESPDPTHIRLAEQLATAEGAAIAARTRRDALESAFTQKSGDLKSLPAHEMSVGRLLRERETGVEIYKVLLTQLYGAKLNEENASTSIRVVAPAIPPERPDPRGRLRMLAGALFLGMWLGLGLIGVRELRDPRVRPWRDLEEEHSVPVLARVGRGRAPSAAVGEDIRILARALRAEAASEDRWRLVLCGTGPEGGGADLALEFSRAAGELGGSVVLIDADLREPILHQILACEPEPGFADLIRQGGEGVGAGLRAPEQQLAFVPAGALPDDAGAMLGSPATGRVLESLAARYPTMVVNASARAGGALLAQYGGTIVVVVEPLRTKAPDLTRLLHALGQLHGRVRGLIVLDPA